MFRLTKPNLKYSLYDPRKDPMLKLSPEELLKTKKNVEREGTKVFRLAYQITAGCLSVITALFFILRDQDTKSKTPNRAAD